MPKALPMFSNVGVHSFQFPITEFWLTNDGSTDVSFYFGTDINNGFTIKAGEVFDEEIGSQTMVTVSSGTFRAYGRG